MLKTNFDDNLVGLFVKDIISFVENFNFHLWSFVKGGGNRVAHNLIQKRLWKSNVPKDIHARVLDEMYAYNTDNII